MPLPESDPANSWLRSLPGQRFHWVTGYYPGRLERRPALTLCGRALPLYPTLSRMALLVTPDQACVRCAAIANNADKESR